MLPKDKINKVEISDIVILLFVGVVFATYQYGKNLSPEHLLFFIQMVLLWSVLKIIYRFFPIGKTSVLSGLLLWGVVEAVWGLGQLYNFFPLKHALFKTTGSFYNPGPFGGFIALMFPLAIHFWLRFRYTNKWAGYLALSTVAICLMVFPATLSRTAWIAALAGCLLVLLAETRLIILIRIFCRRRRKTALVYFMILCLLIVVGVYGIYHLKKDSADGRLFMWKTTALAICESPVKGTGLGGFPAAYAAAQMEYFGNGNETETEKMVAGSPEYAFNEYLQVFMEQGLFGFILFLFLTFLVIRSGIRNKQVGAAGSFITLSVFAFASYPFQLWQFPIAWVLLGTVCTARVDETSFVGDKRMRSKHTDWKKIIVPTLSLVVLCSVAVMCVSRQKLFFHTRKEWEKLKPVYSVKAYENVLEDYSALYLLLDHEPKFVFEYGMALNACGQLEKSDSVFTRGLERSCDPMFHNVKGRNYHEMGEYIKAEACYTSSTQLLPGRVYPYYLLVKLYADSLNFQPEKMKKAALAVMEMEAKVNTLAIREMRDEIQKILKEKGIADGQ